MRNILKLKKKGQLSLSDAPTIVLLVGLVFLVMATIAFIGTKYGDAVKGPAVDGCNATDTSACPTAFQVTEDLNTEIANNTSIAGIVLTISLVGIVLTVLIGIFLVARAPGRS